MKRIVVVIDPDRIAARYNDDVLRGNRPKTAAAKHQEIEINIT